MGLSENYSKTKRFRPLGAPTRARFWILLVYFLVIILGSVFSSFLGQSGLIENLMRPKTLCNNKSGASLAPEAHKVFNKSGWPEKPYAMSNKSGASSEPEAHKVFNKSVWPRKLYAISNKSGARFARQAALPFGYWIWQFWLHCWLLLGIFSGPFWDAFWGTVNVWF